MFCSAALAIDYALGKINIVDRESISQLDVDPSLELTIPRAYPAKDNTATTGVNAVVNQDTGKKTIISNKDVSKKLIEADKGIALNTTAGGVKYNDQIVNVLLIGTDRGSSSNYWPRSDSMIIASINKINKTVSLISLSRASYVAIPGYENTRLNAAYAYGGPNLLIETIELNYKIRIDKFVTIDFEGFKKLVDIFGGVDIELTQSEFDFLQNKLAAKGLDVSKGAGAYVLDGDLALEYARLRSIDTDRNRTVRQRKILKALRTKAESISVSQTVELVNEILPLVTTDITKSELVLQAANLAKYSSWKLNEATVPLKSGDLVLVNGSEVLILNWDNVRSDMLSLLYP